MNSYNDTHPIPLELEVEQVVLAFYLTSKNSEIQVIVFYLV